MTKLSRSFIKRCIRNLLTDSLYDGLVVAYWRWRNSLFGTYEPEIRILEHFVRPGDHVIDMGANMGQYTSKLSKLVGPTGKVLAIEALSLTYTLGRRIVKSLNVEWVNVALSDEEKQVTLRLEMDEDGAINTGRTSIARQIGKPERFVTVRTARLDTILYRRPRGVSFIKCDVEGHEVEVISGAMSVIEKDRPYLLIETSSDNLPSLAAMLGPLGYSVFSLNGLELQSLNVEKLGGGEKFNCFFVRQQIRADNQVVVL